MGAGWRRTRWGEGNKCRKGWGRVPNECFSVGKQIVTKDAVNGGRRA